MRSNFVLLVALGACATAADTPSNETDAVETDTVDSEVVDSEVVPAGPTFAEASAAFASCTNGVCHGGGAAGLTLKGTAADREALVNVESTGKPSAILVVPGDSSGSYLIQKLEDAPGIVGNKMPTVGTVSEEDLQTLKDWIDAGALAD